MAKQSALVRRGALGTQGDTSLAWPGQEMWGGLRVGKDKEQGWGRRARGKGSVLGREKHFAKPPRGGRLSSIPLGTPARQVCSWERWGEKKGGKEETSPVELGRERLLAAASQPLGFLLLLPFPPDFHSNPSAARFNGAAISTNAAQTLSICRRAFGWKHKNNRARCNLSSTPARG